MTLTGTIWARELARGDNALSSKGIAVARVLGDHADRRLRCKLLHSTIAREARIADRSVRRGLFELRAIGALVDHRTRGASAFTLTAPESGPTDRTESGPAGRSEPQTGPTVRPERSDRPIRPASQTDRSSPSEESPSEEHHYKVARRVFAYWQTTCEHPHARPSRDRLDKIRARLREGYTEADIRTAIDGAARAAFVSPSGVRFDDLELICRNGSKLESFVRRAEAPAVDTPRHGGWSPQDYLLAGQAASA